MQLAKDQECYKDFDEAIEIDETNANIYHHRGQVSWSFPFTVWIYSLFFSDNTPANIYLFIFNNRNTKKKCEIC